MGIRLPLQTVLDTTQTDQGPGSVAGGWPYPFKIPQDTDNVVVKFTPSVTAGGISVIFQTSDDGGTTYYDVARTSIASANGLGAAAQWMSIPTISSGQKPNAAIGSVVAVGSVVANGAAFTTIGTASASTLGSGQISGLPILGQQNRLFLISTGNATAISGRMQVQVNNESQGR